MAAEPLPFTVHGLLFLSSAPTAQEAPNMRRRLSPSRRHWQYIGLAHRLAVGLRRYWGSRLCILTNSSAQLETEYQAWRDACGNPDGAFDVRTIEFGSGLPQSATFHAATNKIYAFRHFASCPGASMLLDLDILCRAPLPSAIVRIIERGVPLVLDLSEGIDQRTSHDLNLLAGRSNLHRWYGGEFICGSPGFFGQLFDRVQAMIPLYRDCHASLIHQGDEMLVSAALGAMQQDGLSVCDVSNLAVIQRHWFIASNGDYRRLRDPAPCLLHLPSLKGVLDSRLQDETIVRLCHRLDGLPYIVSRKAVRWLNALFVRR